MKRIAFWTSLPGAGGSELVWHEVAERIAAQGHPVLVSLFDTPANAGFIARSASWRSDLELKVKPTNLMSAVARRLGRPVTGFKKRLRAFRPDALVINSDSTGWIMDRVLIDTINALNIPFVVIVHGAGGFFEDSHRELARTMYQRASRVFFVSGYSRQMIQRHLCCALPQATMFRNPVNRSVPLDSYPAFPSLDDGVNFATVSRLNCYTKGHDFLLESLSDPRFASHEFRVNIFGDGPHARYISEMISYFGLQDRVFVRGFAKDIRSVWEESHVHLLPSISEGAPLALVEAMLCARPSVATRVSGVPEWITEGENGFIAENANPWNLIPAIEAALKSVGRLEAMGLSARDQGLRQIGDPIGDLHAQLSSIDGFL
ncbi:MAG: glycosyltransferase family 4 protein [Minwuia sp.]|nr:glycosyltransferase family 4 protein [Minwuia sp.]